jgi:hypothetical protein
VRYVGAGYTCHGGNEDEAGSRPVATRLASERAAYMPPLQQTGLNRKVRKEREEEIYWSRYVNDSLRCLCVLGGLSGSSARAAGRSLSLGVPYYRKCHPEGGAEGAELRDLWKLKAAAERPIDSSAHSLPASPKGLCRDKSLVRSE